MFADLNKIPDRGRLECDVCIVGAGAAGITIARELDRTGLSVLLVEAGGLKPPRIDANHPYNGQSSGIPYPVLGSRLRYFGGSTNHWGGWCRPLDPIDFKVRDILPLSGWPIPYSEIAKYYPKAEEICEISPPGFELTDLPGTPRPAEEFFASYDSDFQLKNFRFSPPTRFGERYRSDLQGSANVSCLLNSSLVEIEAAENRVSGLRFRAGQKSFSVKAGATVLALGGIENARMLLASNRHDPGGLGNQTDWVGRCFADHIGKIVGIALTSAAVPYVRYRRGGVEVFPHIAFREEFLLRKKLLNFGIAFLTSRKETVIKPDFFDDQRLYPDWKGSTQKNLFYAIVRIETVPNRESRVTLIEERDPNGVPRVDVNWQIHGAEFENLNRIADLMGQKMGARNLGRFCRTFFDTEEDRGGDFTTQAHHLGTTRMSENPGDGVVDADCRVHTLKNLFIAGSSVFPTFGFANPTLTIVALAARLGDHLKGRPWSRPS